MTNPDYNAHTRRQFIASDERTLTLRERGAAVAEHFGLAKAPSPATISKDLKYLAAQVPEQSDYYASLLQDPERFPEWRGHFFSTRDGVPYDTPEHQMALFHCVYAFVFKTRLPDWVIEYLDLPLEINDDIIKAESLLSLMLLIAPRHGKTELMIHAIIYILARDPSKIIIYCSGILSTSQDNMGLVMQEMETNEELMEAYGPFRSDDKRWSYFKGFMLAKAPPLKTPNMYPIGIMSNYQSKDADIIIIDDPQEQESAESETATEKMFRKLRTNLMTRREPHTPLFMIGSHQPSETGDLWASVEESADQLNVEGNKLYIRKIRAHDYAKCDPVLDPKHEKCVLWNKVRPFWFLEAQRAALTDIMYEVTYNQEGRLGRITYFHPDVVRGDYYEPRPEISGQAIPIEVDYSGGILDRSRNFRAVPTGHCRQVGGIVTALGFDPAKSERKGASYSALVVKSACMICNRRFLVDYEFVRQSPEKHPELILKFVEAYRPSRVRIEVNAYMAALSRDPRLTSQQGILGFSIEEWNTDERKHDPRMGIPTLWHTMKEGRLSVPYKDTQDQAFAEEYLREFITWPKKPNDIPMADWFAELSLRTMIEESNNIKSIFGPGYEDMPEYLKDQALVIPAGALRGRDARRRGW